ncbi:hypothetical protein [Euzebya sp.]|uniref:hypothetical protein n=1 Tax=Euzebya sp. TaxID=1971409 RepID=UPI003514C522
MAARDASSPGAGRDLVQVVGRLWPAAEAVDVVRARSARRTGSTDDLLFVPTARRPWLLVPDQSRAAAAGVLRVSQTSTAADRLVRAVLAGAFRAGIAQLCLVDRVRITGARAGESIVSHLSAVLGRAVVVSLGVGTLRANQKPILQVFDQNGSVLAFVKVGDDEVSTALVDREARSLARLAGLRLRHLTLPRVLHHGSWRGLRLLVIGALPTPVTAWAPRRAVPVAALAELARAEGVEQVPVGAGPVVAALRSCAGAVEDRAVGRSVGALADALVARHGAVAVEHGIWHGDWTPWNMAFAGRQVSLWDWERCADGVPVGADALHYVMQRRARETSDWDDALAATTRIAPALLGALGVRAPAAPVVDAYLALLCARYLLAAEGPNGAALALRARWALEVTERRLS